LTLPRGIYSFPVPGCERRTVATRGLFTLPWAGGFAAAGAASGGAPPLAMPGRLDYGGPSFATPQQVAADRSEDRHDRSEDRHGRDHLFQDHQPGDPGKD